MNTPRLHPLAREISVILVLKVIALVTLYSMFFADKPPVDPAGVTTHLLSSASASATPATPAGQER